LADLQRVQSAELPHVEEGELDRGEVEETPSSPVKLGLLVLGAVAVLAVLASLALVDWGGKTDGIPLAERRRAFHRQVEGQLAAFQTVGLQIRCVEGLRQAAAESFEEDYLDQKLERLNQELSGQVESLLDREAGQLEQTFDQLSWNRTMRDFEDRVKGLVFAEVGIQVSQLRATAADAYKKEWGELEDDVRAKILVRESEFERAVVDYGQRLHSKVGAHLSEPDFLQAGKEMAAGLQGFDRVSGDIPRTADLPEKLREFARQARRKHATDLDTLITTRERSRLKTFESGLQDVTLRVEQLLSNDDPREARSIYGELSGALERDFPRRFRVQHDPWPDADVRLGRLGAKLASAESAQRRVALGQLVGTTYRIVLSGDLGKARSELVVGAAGRQETALPKHIKLLDYAISVRSRLLGTLLGTKKLHRLKDVRTRLGALDVELRKRGSDFILQAAGRRKPIALGLLQVRDLVPPDFLIGLTAEHRAGLAVWYLLTGVDEVAFLTEGSPLSEFIRDQLAPALRQLKRPEPGWLADRQLLESVRKAVELAQWVEAEKALSSLRSRSKPFAADNDQELRRLERAIRSGTARSLLETELRSQVLEGGRLQVGAGLGVSLEYQDLGKVAFPGGLPSGWNREEDSGRLVFDDDHVALEEAKELAFASLCVTNKPMSVGFEFAVAADRGVTRLFFLTMHAATLGVAALRDGTLAIFEVDKLRAGKELRDRVQKALRSAERQPQVYLVPGARHRIDIDVWPRGLGGRVVLGVRVDGRQLPEVSIVRSTGRIPATVTLTTLHSLEAYSMVFQGAGR